MESMEHRRPPEWVSTTFAPLLASFGDRLVLARDGDRVHWSYDGRTAIVEMRDEERVSAHFVDRPLTCVVGATPTAAVYRRSADGYALDRPGCERMVADIVAFFSGMREPHFTFVAMT